MEEIYELAYLLSNTLGEEELDKIDEKIETILKAGKAKIIKSEKPRKMRLAYPIQKQGEAFLASKKFQTEQSQIIESKKSLEKIPSIIRFLIVKRREFSTETPDKKPNKKKQELAGIEQKLDSALK